ncbi:MAG: ABC transporter permease, partial [Cellulosilyticaceae bacterium]
MKHIDEVRGVGMFFRMLKNDLRRKKMMNITLFLFILFASIISSICMAQIYQATWGLENTLNRTQTADYTLMAYQRMKDCDAINERIVRWVEGTDYITSYSHEWMVKASYTQVDFVGIEDERYPALSTSYYIGKLPTTHNLVFDRGTNQPFTLANGTIAISNGVADASGVGIGDTVRIRTDLGHTYEFTIATIFKDVLFPMGTESVNKRLFVSEENFRQILSETPIPWNFYNFSTPDRTRLIADFSEASGGYLNQWIDRSEVIYSFIFQNILVIITLILSLFLLVIILLTLRFTLQSSLLEDTKEIGMMRAIGIAPRRFKLLYIAKYSFLAVAGTGIGCVISIPISYKVGH